MINSCVIEGKPRVIKPVLKGLKEIKELSSFNPVSTVPNPEIEDLRQKVDDITSNVEDTNKKIDELSETVNQYMSTTPRLDIDLSEVFDVLDEFKKQIETINENVANLQTRKATGTVPQIKIERRKK